MIAIKTQKMFTTSDGTKHESLREAKIHELTKMFEGGVASVTTAEAITAATLCVQQDDRVVDVLTTKENSLPTARKINGGRKVRAKRGAALAEAVNGEPATTTAA